MVAVADLLDEDANRCDTKTLVQHRHGSLLNVAHWLRHGLSANRVLVQSGVIHVTHARPPGTASQLAPVFAALRNHYRLSLLYSEALDRVGAGLLSPIRFDPHAGVPSAEASDLENWHLIQGLNTQSALAFHLLSSFMPEALLDNQRLGNDVLGRLVNQGLEPVDLLSFHAIRANRERRTPYELAFRALIGAS
jgi:hypothetical protein